MKHISPDCKEPARVIISNNYFGITHFVPVFLLKLWGKTMCRYNYHAFDEVWSEYDHYLICDACELSVEIAFIDITYCEFYDEMDS